MSQNIIFLYNLVFMSDSKSMFNVWPCVSVSKAPGDLTESLAKSTNNESLSDDDLKNEQSRGSISSMQSLLTNIQGLLKVAADNACLQEKQSSIEIGGFFILI